MDRRLPVLALLEVHLQHDRSLRLSYAVILFEGDLHCIHGIHIARDDAPQSGVEEQQPGRFFLGEGRVAGRSLSRRGPAQGRAGLRAEVGMCPLLFFRAPTPAARPIRSPVASPKR